MCLWQIGTYRVCDILQGGREGVNELVGQLGKEADGVHVEYSHATGQLTGMDSDVQCGKKLIFGLETSISCQCFNESGLSWRETMENNKRVYLIATNGGLSNITSYDEKCCMCVQMESVLCCQSLTTIGIAHNRYDGEVFVFTLGAK